jgi:S1-C subfamily serine protease
MKTKHSALLLACLLVASTITLPAHDDWTWEKINQIANNPTKLAAIKGKAEKGDAGAQYILGRVYDQGNDQGRQTESTKWYRRAAVQGNANAQFSLGHWYSLGVGVPRNYVEAYKWCDLAAAHLSDDRAGKIISDLEDCRIELSVIEKYMTPEQISEAQRLAAAFVPRTETPGSDANSTSPVAADSPVASGTGFFITADGYLISNYHVVKGAGKVRLLTSAGLIDTKLVQVDAANDLALLKASGRFAPLPVAASRRVALGGTVATVGFPDIGLQGFAPKLAKGEIASLSGARDDPRYFQISVPVQPGNSGGALVDERGNVIGIVSAKLDASVALAASGALPENVNYAVKSSLLLSFLESVPDVDAKLKAPNTGMRSLRMW